MLAARVFAAAIFRPIRGIHQPVERVVVFIGDQVAGSFPAFDISSRIAPRSAREIALTREEFQVHG